MKIFAERVLALSLTSSLLESSGGDVGQEVEDRKWEVWDGGERGEEMSKIYNFGHSCKFLYLHLALFAASFS